MTHKLNGTSKAVQDLKLVFKNGEISESDDPKQCMTPKMFSSNENWTIFELVPIE